MNQILYITIFVTIAIIAITQAGEVGENSKSQSNEHGSNLLEESNKLQNEDKLCDVTITIGDKSFRAHKDILSSGSPYFKAMFKNENMRESLEQSNSHTITLHDLDAKAFEMLKDYMYTSQILIDDSTVQSLLAGASYLQMTDIEADCCAYMKNEVNAENCIGIKYIGDKYSCNELLNYAKNFILEAFKDVARGEEFLRSTESQVIDIISDDELATSEDEVYEAVMRWIRYQDDRAVHLPDILQHVRFSQMTPKYLAKVLEDTLIKACEQCREYVNEAGECLKMHHRSDGRDEESFLNARFRPRKTDYLFAVGGSIENGNYRTTSSVERYDPRIDKWIAVTSMNSPRNSLGVAALNNILYAVGGFSVSYLSSSERYDPHTNKWTDNIKPLETAQDTYASVTALNGFLYTLDSFDYSRTVLQKYDPNINEWVECKPLRQKRYYPAVGVLDGYIYVLGGTENGKLMNTVERYDPKQNEWHDVSPMIKKRSFFAAAAHGGYLYAVGGLGPLISGERYDSLTQKWEEIAPMNEHRYDLGLAVANGLIYAVGGKGLDEITLNTVEVYDPSTNTWSGRAPMLHKRHDFGLAAIKY